MSAVGGAFASLDDYYRRGPFNGIVEERREVPPASAQLFRLSPPAGSYPKPPTPDFNLVLTTGRPYHVSLDFGAGRWRRLTARGEMGLQPPDSAASIVVDDAHDILIVSIPRRVVLDRLAEQDLLVTDFGVLHSTTFGDALVEQLCLRMWREAQDGGSRASLFVDTGVTMLVALLARAADLGDRRSHAKGGMTPPRLKRVLAYIHERLGEDLRLDELADVAGLSASQFVRAFRAETRLSPHRYVLEARVEHAKRLLRNGDLGVAEIAVLCGFSSPGHLSTWFRRIAGVSPTAFRHL